jgi:hypothetical protein
MNLKTARHSVRAVGDNPEGSVGNCSAQRTDAPYLCRLKGAWRVSMSGFTSAIRS